MLAFFQQKFDKLILMKIATRCHILKLKCTKFYFGWGSAPDPAGELTAPSDSLLQSLAGFKGPTSNGRRGAKGRGRRERKEAEERRGGKRRAMSPSPIRAKFTRAYGEAEVRERRGQEREQLRI